MRHRQTSQSRSSEGSRAALRPVGRPCRTSVRCVGATVSPLADHRVATILARVESMRVTPATYWRAYESLRRALSRHVGWGATRPELATAEAYEVTMRELDRRLDARLRRGGRHA